MLIITEKLNQINAAQNQVLGQNADHQPLQQVAGSRRIQNQVQDLVQDQLLGTRILPKERETHGRVRDQTGLNHPYWSESFKLV